jgi:lipooligosaccharide transport system permease protein
MIPKPLLSRVNPADAFAVWRRNYIVVLRLWRTEVFPPLFEPILSLFAFGWGIGSLIAGQVGGVPYLTFAGTGILVITGLMRAMFESTYGAYFRMVYQSTYDAILCTPVGIESLAAAEIGWGAAKALFDSCIIMIVLIPFGVMHSWTAIAIPIVIIAAGVGLSALSIAFTAYAPSINHFNYYISAIFCSIWLCGATFPVDRLPLPLQWASWCLPVTSAVDLCRNLMIGRIEARMALELLWVIASALLFTEIAMRKLRRRMYR